MSATPVTLAARLSRARLRCGYSREQLAAATKVPLTFITALEEENHAALPEAVFCRGFLHILGKHLDVDASPLLAAYDDLPRAVHTPAPLTSTVLARHTARKTTTRGKRTRLWVLIAALSGGVMLYFLLFTPIQEQADPSNKPQKQAELSDKLQEQATVPLQPQPTNIPQRLRLLASRPLLVEIAIDGGARDRRVLLPQNYEFTFTHTAQLLVTDTAALKIWFNDETVGDLRRGGLQRLLTFKTAPHTAQADDADHLRVR